MAIARLVGSMTSAMVLAAQNRLARDHRAARPTGLLRGRAEHLIERGERLRRHGLRGPFLKAQHLEVDRAAVRDFSPRDDDRRHFLGLRLARRRGHLLQIGMGDEHRAAGQEEPDHQK